MAGVGPSSSEVTLHIKRHYPIKRRRLADLLKTRENKIHLYALQETHVRYKDTKKVKVKGWKKIFLTNRAG